MSTDPPASPSPLRLLSAQLPATDEQFMVTDPQLGEVIVVEHHGIHAYQNHCPHVGVSLDYGDGDCLYEPGILICSLHGALFAADSGLCLAGPCRGDSLTPIPITLSDDGIMVSCTTP